MTDDCIFCKIANGELPAQKLYEDDDIVAFSDLNPVAPVHFLVIPKDHISTLDDLSEKHEALMGHLLVTATRLAKEQGLSKDGYRQVINCKNFGGQVVYHIHAHIIGGRQLLKMG